ncbi:MAG: tRNA uridine-5-carboxymethylaminomethyl(34) synthesis GTPase MnmE, partial [Clostridia bacterium]
DMCEINSHGGNVIMRKILQICLKNGADLAEPGEFTKRAFLNGRIDLSQAESVIDIINAKSDREAKEGIKQLEGYLATSIRKIKNEILDVMTNIEVSIDYPEYDTPEVLEDDLKKKMEEVLDKLHKLEASFDNGKLIKEGIKTAIIGKPNAGKSSLLNAILKEDRAIVTEYEGTTRDTIEEFVNINGIPLKLIDTAGIRETENEVEKIGIEKSIKYAKEADLVILIIDGSKDLSKEDIEILNIVNPKKTIIILNKIDLEQKIDENTPEIVKFNNIIKISALKKEGIDKLYEKINDLFNFNQINVDNDIVITNERHKIQIQKAIQNLNKAIKSLSINMPIDIVAIGLKDVLSDLGEITGEEASEEIINEIFARFCLGK